VVAPGLNASAPPEPDPDKPGDGFWVCGFWGSFPPDVLDLRASPKIARAYLEFGEALRFLRSLVHTNREMGFEVCVFLGGFLPPDVLDFRASPKIASAYPEFGETRGPFGALAVFRVDLVEARGA